MATSDNKPSAGRYAAAGTSLGWHGAVAGKKGKKLRAFGNSAVGSGVVGTGGMLAGAALTRSKAGAQVGSLMGSAAGSIAGMRRNQRKGYLKPQKSTMAKSDTLSAFDVDHGY